MLTDNIVLIFFCLITEAMAYMPSPIQIINWHLAPHSMFIRKFAGKVSSHNYLYVRINFSEKDIFFVVRCFVGRAIFRQIFDRIDLSQQFQWEKSFSASYALSRQFFSVRTTFHRCRYKPFQVNFAGNDQKKKCCAL